MKIENSDKAVPLINDFNLFKGLLSELEFSNDKIQYGLNRIPPQYLQPYINATKQVIEQIENEIKGL